MTDLSNLRQTLRLPLYSEKLGRSSYIVSTVRILLLKGLRRLFVWPFHQMIPIVAYYCSAIVWPDTVAARREQWKAQKEYNERSDVVQYCDEGQKGSYIFENARYVRMHFRCLSTSQILILPSNPPKSERWPVFGEILCIVSAQDHPSKDHTHHANTRLMC